MSNKVIVNGVDITRLLELYKELAIIRNDMLSCCEIVDDEYYDMYEIETNLEKQIKELENDK